ncbi:glycosyltransferase family 39 protein [bacterium]|nr:glycosyltransferase family 39 protein [bacterium]
MSSSKETETQNETPAPRSERQSLTGPQFWAGALRLLGLLALGWAFLEVAYFLRTNTGLFQGDENRPMGVFSGLLHTDWSFSLRYTPPLTFLAAVFVIALTTLLGVLILRALDVWLRPRMELAMGLTIGLGVSGVVFELITIAHALYLPVVWTAWVVMIGAALLLDRRRRAVWRWWKKPEPKSDNWVQALDDPTRADRSRWNRIAPMNQELHRSNSLDHVFWWTGLVLLVAISLPIFWYALFYPETYWDSLILYLGYGRMTFLQHAFPFKATAQVGIGLGANYPHLYSTYGAVASTMFGGWSDLYQRLLAPVAATVSMMFVYDVLLLIWGRRSVAMAGALLFRLTPLGIAYSMYASDYILTILFVAAFLYATAYFAKTRLPGAFAVLSFLPAAAMHLNYLMGILWFPWAIALLLSIRSRKREEAWSLVEEVRIDASDMYEVRSPHLEEDGLQSGEQSLELADFEQSAGDDRGFRPIFLSKAFWIILLVCMMAGSTWYVRNWTLTGNPVYAFFPQIFKSSVHINPEVLKSAELEWFRNGDGIGQAAEIFADVNNDRTPRSIYDEDFQRESTLKNKLQASWFFWQGYETFRYIDTGAPQVGLWLDRLYYLSLVTRKGLTAEDNTMRNLFDQQVRLLINPHAYKMSPLVMGFCLSGLLLGFLQMFFRRSMLEGQMNGLSQPILEVTLTTTIATAICYLGFHYLLGDFYLYQVISWLPALAIIGACPFAIWFSAPRRIERVIQASGMVLIIVAAVVPGLAMSLMGFKIPGGGMVSGQTFVASNLDVFRNPGMPAEIVYKLRFGDEVDIWQDVNRLAKGQPLLTHENRHLLFDPSIELVHLDDWDVQKTYSMNTAKEKLDFFKNRGIQYYLRIPNEKNHPINQKVGLDELITKGYLKKVDEAGGAELYRFN